MKIMVADIFTGLADTYQPEVVDARTSFYFSIEDVKRTVILTPEGCSIADGKTLEEVDCVCKTDPAFFLKIWNDGYRPGMTDFMSGKIKSNNPLALKDFMAAFGR